MGGHRLLSPSLCQCARPNWEDIQQLCQDPLSFSTWASSRIRSRLVSIWYSRYIVSGSTTQRRSLSTSINVVGVVVVVTGGRPEVLLISSCEVYDGVMVVYRQRCASDVSIDAFIIIARATNWPGIYPQGTRCKPLSSSTPMMLLFQNVTSWNSEHGYVGSQSVAYSSQHRHEWVGGSS
jgi:hypothetical protein